MKKPRVTGSNSVTYGDWQPVNELEVTQIKSSDSKDQPKTHFVCQTFQWSENHTASLRHSSQVGQAYFLHSAGIPG